MAKTDDSAKAYGHIAVIGGGAWGTALALAAVQAGAKALLWARESGVVDSINGRHENAQFLPGIALPPAIAATGDLAAAARAPALLIVVPAQHLRAVLKDLAPRIAPGTPLMLCATTAFTEHMHRFTERAHKLSVN